MKNAWKKTLSLLLCLVLLAGLFPAALAESGTISLVQEGRDLNLRACVAGTNARNIVAKVYQGSSYTMSVEASVDEGGILLQGTLLNKGGIWLYVTTGLVLEEGGLYCGNGVLQAPKWNGTAAEFFPWLSWPEYSDYTVSADGGWYFVTREITAEPGDVNGDGGIDSKDLTLLRRLLSGLPAEDKIVAPDVNGDGSFDIRDLVRLRKLLAGVEEG